MIPYSGLDDMGKKGIPVYDKYTETCQVSILSIFGVPLSCSASFIQTVSLFDSVHLIYCTILFLSGLQP